MFLLRYLKLFRSFIKISLISETEHRFNIALMLLADIVWYATQISVFEVLFLNAPQIAGWTIESSRIFLGILFLADSLMMATYDGNLGALSNKVSRGELDLILTKPVNSQFFLSFNKVNPTGAIMIVVSLSYLIWGLSQYIQTIGSENFSYWRLLLLPQLIFSSFILIYSVRFFIVSLTVWAVRADNLSHIWYQFFKLSTRPDSIYPKAFRYFILFILPLAFVSSIPTKIILSQESVWFAFLSPLIAFIFLYGSHRFWNLILRKYTSSSS